MATKKKNAKSGLLSTNALVAENRKARFEYEIKETYEAGLVLRGTEVKMLRHGQCGLTESHVSPKKGELWLMNAHIPEYPQAGPHLQHEPRRHRKLLLHKKEMHELMGAVTKEGMTIVPLKLFFDAKGIARLQVALAKGKKLHDKRQTEKDRDWSRQQGRILRENN